VRSRLNFAFHRSAADGGNFAARVNDCGYLAFMAYYPWGSLSIMSAKAWTFYYFAEQNIVSGSHTAESHRTAAESYLHYIHGVNPFNMVFLTNMNDYGASRSTQHIFHSWFSPWYRTDVSMYGPPPGFLPGGPNSVFEGVDPLFPGNLGGYGSLPVNHPVRLDVIETGNRLIAMQNDPTFPPGKWYVDSDHTWPLNTWEITEPMGAYQVNYIRLLSKFAQEPPPAGDTIIFNAGTIATFNRENNPSIIQLPIPLETLPRMNEMSNPLYRFWGWRIDGTNEYLRTGTISANVTAQWVPVSEINAARPYGRAPFRLGDANTDGRITSADATAIARWLVTNEAVRAASFPDFCEFAADITGTGYITVEDIVVLARWLVGHSVEHLIAQ
jgi:hypothetical protein